VHPAARRPARRFITWPALALLTVGSVGYLGSAPALAVFGLASVFLYVLPALVFLVPVSLVAAELASGWPGGVYNWVEQGISAPMGLLAVWCEFAQTIFYYPALLAYVAGTLAYVIDPRLAGNGVYNAVVIIVLFWGGVLVSSRGMALVARLASGGTLIGTLIPGAILVGLGVTYLLRGNQSAAPMTASHLLPTWTGVGSIVLVVNSFFTYAGVEVNAVHVDELRNPGRDRDETAPRATGSSPRLQGSGAGRALPARRAVIGGRAGDRVHPSGTVRPLQPAHLRRLDTRRDPRHRDRPAAATGPPPPAGVEGSQ
jgi:glutamate:GABA antiporter